MALSAMLVGSGCEIAIPIIAAETVEESDPIDEPFVLEQVDLEVVEASGFVVDRPVEGLALDVPFGFDASGGFFTVSVAGSPEVEVVEVNTCGGGFEDPYGGLPGGGGGRGRPGPVGIDAGVPDVPSAPPEDPSFATPCGEPRFLVTACGPSECVNPEQAIIERTETADGIELVVEASWAGGHPMTLRLREVR